MIDPEFITDQTELADWLTGRSREDHLALLNRACQRLALAYCSPDDPERALVVLRGCMIVSAATLNPSINFSQVAHSAGRRARYWDIDGMAAALDALEWEFAGSLDRRVAEVEFVAQHELASRIAHQDRNGSLHWKNVSIDCQRVELHDDVFRHPLWTVVHDEIPDHWHKIRSNWQTLGSGWVFWINWYQSLIDGKPALDAGLIRDIAMIPADDWERGDAHVNGVIAVLQRKHALAATFNGEDIALNPETGKLRLVPVTDLPADIADYARRKIGKAIRLFGDRPANQYTSLAPVIADLNDALTDAANLPVELFDACASASRRIEAHARLGDCPPPDKDATVADFLARIREAGADIVGSDPKTQDVLERRNAVLGNDALIEGRAIILAVAAQLAEVSEGHLAVAMPRDADAATDPAADAESRAISAFKVSGRLLRYGALGAAGIGGAIVGTKEVLEAIPSILASPYYQQTIEFVLRHLNF